MSDKQFDQWMANIDARLAKVAQERRDAPAKLAANIQRDRERRIEQIRARGMEPQLTIEMMRTTDR